MAFKRRKYGRFSKRFKRRYVKRRFRSRYRKYPRSYRKSTFSSGRIFKTLQKPIYAKFHVEGSIINVPNQNSYNVIYQNSTFQADLYSAELGYSESFTLYNYYRIVKVIIHIEFFPKPFTILDTNAAINAGTSTGTFFHTLFQHTKPTFAFWKDTSCQSATYAASQAGWEDILNKDQVHFKKTNDFRISFKPRPRLEGFESAATTAEIPMKSNPWVSTNEQALDWGAINIYMKNADNFLPIINEGMTTIQKYRISHTAYIEFKDRRK